MHGLAVTTVEGIGSTQDRLHPVQERIAKSHGSQCGFCTPGIVMSMYALLRNKNKIEYADIETALQGNLCRCTGYRPIIEGFKTFIEGWERHYVADNAKSPCSMGEACCRLKKDACDENNTLFNKSTFVPYDPSQEPIFPPELKIRNSYNEEYLYYKGENVTWIRPTNLEELINLKAIFRDSKIVAGNTEIGVEVKFKKKKYPIFITPSNVSELNFCKTTNEGIMVGASYTLSDLKDFLEKQISEKPIKAKIFVAIRDMLHWFAGSQVRNIASLVGNIITASPISDLNPILMACRAILYVSSNKGQRKVVIDENFFIGYRKTAIEDNEVVVCLEIPNTKNNQYFKAYKQARRRDDDISIVTATFNVEFQNNDQNIVSEARLCYGGMAPTTVLAKNTSQVLKGLKWDTKMLNIVLDSLTKEMELDISVPGGLADYRKSLCLSLFFRFYLDLSQKLNKNGYSTNNEASGANEIPILPSSSSQYFDIRVNPSPSDAVGKPIIHTSALKQATGEAMYCDDLPHIEGELYLSLVFSKEAHAKIKSIDASKALALPGVITFLSAADLDDECNKMGPILKDEEIFSKELVTSRACVVGAIVAQSEKIARTAKELVSVTYEKLEPVIISIEDAIKHKSYYPNYPRVLKKGGVNEVFSKSRHTVEGEIRTGAQEHFYLETISAYAIRKEDELEIIATTQSPAEVGVIYNIFD